MLKSLYIIVSIMVNATVGPRRVAQIAAGLASLAGVYGFLYLMGAFGSVSCSQTSGGTEGCVAGIDYLVGSAGSNASTLFFWAVLLLSLVAIGGIATWTNHRRITWGTAIVSVGISVFSIWLGWFFMVSAVGLLTAAIALSVSARRDNGNHPAPATG